MTIGNRIKYYRELIGMSQTELAKRCNTSKQNIFKYENDMIAHIPLERFNQIADVLGISPSVLMGLETHTESLVKDEVVDVLKDNPHLRMLLSASSKLSDEDIQQLYRLASLMGKEN